MLKWILFLLLSLNLFALEISIESAKDDFAKYSTLHINNSEEFICQEIKNEFDLTTEIICAFRKKPSQNIQTITNEFFNVSTVIKDDTFFISIKPIHKVKLLSEVFDLTKDSSVYDVSSDFSKRWLIIGYRDTLPLIYKDKDSIAGLNLPFFLDKDKLPFVGSLDIKGNPVHIKRVGDVKEYIKIKKYFNEKRYERCLEIIDDIMQEYPDTLFKAELLYYKIKVYSQLKDYDDVVLEANVFLREYSANENLAEILSLIAKAYSNIGLISEAEYFFDRLFSEHYGSVSSEWGYIYMGEMLESSGSLIKALQFYKKALAETSSIEVAASAAYHLATSNLELNPKESAQYIEKIINAKPSFFIQNLFTAQTMMYVFAEEGDYITAASMGQALIDEIDASYDEYENYLKDIALWLAKTENKEKALEAINKYIKQFPDGDYIAEIDIVKDALFFDTPDLNATTRLAEYEKLIDVYNNDTIGNRAIYERAKLLFEMGDFTKIIQNKDELLQLDAEVYPDKEDIVTNAAIGLMEKSLKAKKCENVIVISNDYNITLSNEWDDGIYECAMKGGDYQLAQRMIVDNLKSPDIDLRKKWLYRYVKVGFSLGNYSDVIGAANDLVTLMLSTPDDEYKKIYRYLFDSYNRVEQKDKLVVVMDKLEELFGLTYEDIERYVTMLSIGSANKDDNMVIKYASKVMKIQESSSSSAQSPYVEFTLYQSYINIQNYNLAFDVIESLNSVKLNKLDSARQKYLLGSVLMKLWRNDEAKIAFEEAVEADPDSAWAKLAKSALNL